MPKSKDDDSLEKAALFYSGLNGNEARILRQEICQFGRRPDYAFPRETMFPRDMVVPREDGPVPGMREMVCVILRLMLDTIKKFPRASLEKPPKAGLAFVLGVGADQITLIVNKRDWPDVLPLASSFRDAVRWLVIGGQALVVDGRGESDTGVTLHSEDEGRLLDEIALDIYEYFFPTGTEAHSTEAEYFNVARRLSDAPTSILEMEAIIRWFRHQLEVRNQDFAKGTDSGMPMAKDVYVGQIIIVATTTDAVRVFDESEIREEIAQAAVQSEHLDVVLLRPVGNSDAARFSDWIHDRCKELKPEPLGTLQMRDVQISPNSELAHPLFGYIYFAHGARSPRRARLLVVRTHRSSAREKASLTFTATKHERDKFVPWVERCGVNVLKQ